MNFVKNIFCGFKLNHPIHLDNFIIYQIFKMSKTIEMQIRYYINELFMFACSLQRAKLSTLTYKKFTSDIKYFHVNQNHYSL